MSIYRLKPAFQNLLRPAAGWLARSGVTANMVTLAACAVSVALGLGLYLWQPPAAAYLLIAVWMLVRMALNALDGMLAREFGQRSKLGAFLNELTDVVSDAALYLPFAALLPSGGFWIGLVIFLSGLSEFAGALGPTVGASRRYDGPMGKSDRAFVFGLLALYVASGAALPPASIALLPVIAVLVAWTTVNRVRNALAEAAPSQALEER
jgi:CDP-diacylglycerol--glycerol-3-phosphate 3-phosphatidyltransferase